MAIFLTALLVVACGPSPEEIDNIAIITCNVMGESRNMDAAFRIKEINAAREKIGAAPYLGTDQEIKESLRSGTCKWLVKGYDNPVERRVEKLSEDMRNERKKSVSHGRNEKKR